MKKLLILLLLLTSIPVFSSIGTTGTLKVGTGNTYEVFYSDPGDIYTQNGKAYLGKGINLSRRYRIKDDWP